jgi:hypothetical protein
MISIVVKSDIVEKGRDNDKFLMVGDWNAVCPIISGVSTVAVMDKQDTLDCPAWPIGVHIENQPIKRSLLNSGTESNRHQIKNSML